MKRGGVKSWKRFFINLKYILSIAKTSKAAKIILQNMKREHNFCMFRATSVCGLEILVYEALSFECMRP